MAARGARPDAVNMLIEALKCKKTGCGEMAQTFEAV